MFGVLMGTLLQFRTDEKQKETQVVHPDTLIFNPLTTGMY